MSSIKSFLHSSSSRGVTTTHPWCSVFTRFFSFIVSIVKQLLKLVKSMANKFSKMKDNSKKPIAVFLCIMLVLVSGICKVYAEAFPIPPIWLPLNPYNAQGLEENYVLLNDDQKKIVNEVIGAYSIVYLGMGSYALTSPINGIEATREFFQEYGSSFLNTFWDQVMSSSRAMTNFVGSTIYKASTYDTYAEYEADTAPSVTSSDHKYFQIDPELTVAWKTFYRVNGGVEQWQNHIVDLSTINPFTWKTGTHQTLQTQYNSYISNAVGSKCRINFINGNYNIDNALAYSNDGMFSTYHNLFLDSSNGTAYLVDDNGNRITGYYKLVCYIDIGGWMATSWQSSSMSNRSINITGFSTLNSAVEYIFSNSGSRELLHLDNFSNNGSACLSDFITNVYYGSSWATRQPWTMVEDLNIGVAPTEYIDNVGDEAFGDINAIIDRIADQVTDLRSVIDDAVLVKDGTEAIPYADAITKAIDKYLTEPESKVVIVPGLFKNLGKYITYLYQQTKPLILYTRDLITCLTFDGTGMSWVFFGAVSCGLIGGVLCKFLL